MVKTLFLPGASGSSDFWRPLATCAGLDGVHLAWPGLGIEPIDTNVNSVDDLVKLAANHISEPVDIIAQSFGGIIAIRLALLFPHLVHRLVLAVTSGGIPNYELDVQDWRHPYFELFPNAARWIADPISDYSDQLPSIMAPALLLWGDADPISPISVGMRLMSLLPDARLQVVSGGAHNLAQTHCSEVARAIMNHLGRSR